MLGYLKDYKRESVLAPLFKMLEATFDLFVPLVMADIVNIGIAAHDFHYILVRCGILLLLAMIGLACSLTAQYFSAKAAVGYSTALRHALFEHIQTLSFTEMDTLGTSTLITRMTSDVNQVQSGLNLFLRLFLRSPFVVIGAMVMAFTVNSRAALIFVVTIPLLSVVVFGIMAATRPLYKTVQNRLDRVLGLTRENLTGVRVVRAFGQQQYEVEKFTGASADYKKKSFKVSKLLAVYWAGSDTMCMIQSGITLIMCVLFAARGEITVGTMVVFTSYVGKLLWPIRQLGRILSDAGKSFVAVERIDEILRAPVEPAEPDAIQPPLNGDIVFDHVTFGYDSNRNVLQDMSFTIPAGKTVAILGATGSGKSSIVHLMQRLFEPQSGRITIGGVDIQKIDRSYLRAHVGLVLQEPFLYSKTLRDNVGIAVSHPSQQAIERAAVDASALSFIEDSENGWNTVVGERGVTLSGGQKQRIAIARTLMKDNDILIFDDSLSAVDTETDAAIRHALKEHSRDTTTIIISHRVVTLSQADLILVVEDGHIIQQGTHQQLIHQPGLYARIFNIQTALEEEFARHSAQEVN